MSKDTKKEVVKIEMPDFFSKDVTGGINEMLKGLNIPLKLPNRNNKSMEVFKKFVDTQIPAQQGKLINSYYKNLVELAWDKLRLIHPSLMEADQLKADYEVGTITGFVLDEKEKADGSMEGFIDFMRKMRGASESDEE